ncbi:MAG TPA: dihydrofolate reductase family protein [Candidatus Saccharimonadales bacterium]|nr:dihydrofolate reductase family protein [Candidatus Saccharimonadales bacterium]
MKVFIIAAVTADGFIGADKTHSSLEWSTQADKRFFVKTTKDAGVTVFGRTTFETFNRALPGRRTIVLTTQPQSITLEGIEPTSESPAALVSRLRDEGVEQLAVCGGSTVYGQFLEANLVDELFLTVHPTVFGAGVPLFNQPIHRNLTLLTCKDIGDQTILLHYKVIT